MRIAGPSSRSVANYWKVHGPISCVLLSRSTPTNSETTMPSSPQATRRSGRRSVHSGSSNSKSPDSEGAPPSEEDKTVSDKKDDKEKDKESHKDHNTKQHSRLVARGKYIHAFEGTSRAPLRQVMSMRGCVLDQQQDLMNAIIRTHCKTRSSGCL